MRAMPVHRTEELLHPAVKGGRIRVYVWDLVVRNTHWVIALSMVVLAATGLYIAHPFGFPGGTPSPHFLMGWVRVVHSYAAIFFTLAVLVRIIWLFVSPGPYSRWTQFLPWQRYRRREMVTTLKFYLFARRDPPGEKGIHPDKVLFVQLRKPRRLILRRFHQLPIVRIALQGFHGTLRGSCFCKVYGPGEAKSYAPPRRL